MIDDVFAPATGPARERDGLSRDVRETRRDGPIAANAAKVLDTTRRAWGSAAAQAPSESAARPPRAAKPKKRFVPRQSRWPNLLAALNHWSPTPL
ncbi:hypothetical protein [Caballeronia insecticola]|uniref:Uncharacterized protein n=1 Tax=Caballeronia insecticola TaxID=758793 RepID=R4WRQ4_9BURK|nr:hypothetical protein [Caballeronia insecticola]BAN23625.1 hypothetical protein BRPE64_ACDS18710 [Caballeronia insecticola]